MKAERSFEKIKTQTALWLPWDAVGEFVSFTLEQLLNKPFAAEAEYCDVDYWCCEFGANYIDVAMQERLFEAIDATEDERTETIACDETHNGCTLPINSLGMGVSKKILLLALGITDAQGVPITEDGLWVIYNAGSDDAGGFKHEF